MRIEKTVLQKAVEKLTERIEDYFDADMAQNTSYQPPPYNPPLDTKAAGSLGTGHWVSGAAAAPRLTAAKLPPRAA